MLTLWTDKDIAAKISPEEFHRIGIFLSQQEEPEGMNVATVDAEGRPVSWEVERFHWMPAESVTAILRLVGMNSILLHGYSDQDGVKLKQVFKRTKMIPRVDYVDLVEYNRDPGDRGVLGSLI